MGEHRACLTCIFSFSTYSKCVYIVTYWAELPLLLYISSPSPTSYILNSQLKPSSLNPKFVSSTLRISPDPLAVTLPPQRSGRARHIQCGLNASSSFWRFSSQSANSRTRNSTPKTAPPRLTPPLPRTPPQQ